jgi:hypothetical protein
MTKLLERKETEINESKGTNKQNGYNVLSTFNIRNTSKRQKRFQILGFLDASSIAFPATKNRELKHTIM